MSNCVQRIPIVLLCARQGATNCLTIFPPIRATEESAAHVSFAGRHTAGDKQQGPRRVTLRIIGRCGPQRETLFRAPGLLATTPIRGRAPPQASGGAFYDSP